jgi:hypothetical protein
MAEPASDIFISYARENRSFADRLVRDLEANNISTWMDRSNLKGGQEWTPTIQDAIDACQTMLVVLSRSALTSRYVPPEYNYAYAHGKRIIPLIYQRVDLPFPLQGLHAIDFTSNYHERFAELVQLLTTIDPENVIHLHSRRRLWIVPLILAAILVLTSGILFISSSHMSTIHRGAATATAGAGDTATAASVSATDTASPLSHAPTSPSSPGSGTSGPATQMAKTPIPTSQSHPGATNTPTATPKPSPTPTITPTPTSTRSPQ